VTVPLAAASTPALWYLTRGTGAVALLLVTASLVLGIVQEGRYSAGGRLPRFAAGALHRSVSLLVLAFLAVHIITAVADTFAPIRLVDAVVPFAGIYRPLWLGLGAVAFDLLIALTVTSLLRRRIGRRAWRGVHWAAYAVWPVAVLHGLGTGSDAKSAWLQLLTVACVVLVAAAVGTRLLRSGPGRAGLRTVGAGALVAVLLGGAAWASGGPLASGWARRAGTPERLLRPAAAKATAARPTPRPPRDPLAHGFSAALDGTRHQGVGRDGTAVVDLLLHSHPATIRVRLGGSVDGDGGLLMSQSAVYLGPPGDPGRYRGRVRTLDGTHLSADLGSPDGHVLRLTLDLRMEGSHVGGAARTRPEGSVPG
jgi:hypothetical protein